MEKSEVGTLNKTDWKSLAKSLLLTIAAAAAIALADWLGNLDLVTLFGKFAPYIAVIMPFFLNFLRKFGSGK